jgi:hypothetical protein
MYDTQTIGAFAALLIDAIIRAIWIYKFASAWTLLPTFTERAVSAFVHGFIAAQFAPPTHLIPWKWMKVYYIFAAMPVIVVLAVVDFVVMRYTPTITMVNVFVEFGVIMQLVTVVNSPFMFVGALIGRLLFWPKTNSGKKAV